MADETLDQGRNDGPGSLADVAAQHAEGPDAPGPRGRPAEPIDLSTPEGRAKAAKRERDRARYAEKRGRPTSPAVGAARSAPSAESFKPETCRALVRLPFDIAAARLKSASWSLDKDEEALLAGPCADTLNQVLPEVSPKWAALTALGLALFTVTSKKYMMYLEEKNEKASD